MALKFKCRHCHVEIITQFLQVGEIVQCPKCLKRTIVPNDALVTDEKSTVLAAPAIALKDKITKEIMMYKAEQNAKARKNYPSFWQAVFLLVSIMISEFLLGLVLGTIEKTKEFPITLHPVTITILRLLVMGFALKIGINRTKTVFKDMFSLTSFRTILLLPIAMSIIGLIGYSGYFPDLLKVIQVAGNLVTYDYINFINRSFLGAILFICVVTPVTEEFLFRGLILRGFLNHYGEKKAILFSSVLFALSHLQPAQYLHSFAIGLIFAWWRIKTKSLYPALFGHMLNNTIGFTALTVIWAHHSSEDRWILLMFGAGPLLTLMGIWLFNRIVKKEVMDCE